MPYCPGCDNEHLDISDFYADKSRGTGISRLCKECHKQEGRERAKAWYQKNKKAHIQKVLDRRKTLNPSAEK